MTKKIAQNRKARFDVSIEDTLEAGLILTGDEIKSIRAQRAQLVGGYIKILRSSGVTQPVVVGLHLGAAKEPDRVKKLLLHSKQVVELDQLLSAKGMTAVPLSVHFRHGFAKLLVGIGRGRRQHDKRQLLKERSLQREQEQVYRKF